MDSRELVSKACEAMKSAYTPYSGFKVGAALLTKEIGRASCRERV